MPKRNADTITTHRLELNEFERKLLKEYMQSKSLENYGKAAAYASVPAGIAGLFYLGVKIGEASLPVGQKMSEELKEAWDKLLINPKNLNFGFDDSIILGGLGDVIQSAIDSIKGN